MVTSGSTSLVTSSDTYVSRSNPTLNYGSATHLWATDGYYRAFLRYKTGSVVPSGSKATSAKLKLYVVRNDLTTGGFVIHPETDTWVGAYVTWNNQPAWYATTLVTSATPKAGYWITINLPLSAVNFTGDTSLAVTYNLTGSNTQFASREDTTHQPTLVITW